MYKKLTTFIIALLGFVCLISANNHDYTLPEVLNDSAKISILTSAPWPEQVYAVYGHSAIRISDSAGDIDYVFNYGIFDFDSPNFVYRFMAGETDYMVDFVEYKYYILQYQMRGVDVYEQEINLKSSEKQRIWDFLTNNVKPENRVYRYNIFFNNCTTKLTDILENNIDGKIIYPSESEEKGHEYTFRKLVHEHVNKQPWLQFGIDLIIGNGADSVISVRTSMFLPIYQKNSFEKSYILSEDGTKLPLVSRDYIVNPLLKPDNEDSMGITPLGAGLILLLITITISLFEIKRRKTAGNIFDTLLFLIAGIAGVIIFFMMYFSVHPCTNPNWNLVWLNPIMFITGCLFFVKACRKYIYYYHFINFALLLIFLLVWYLIPQQLEAAFIPFIASIGLRSGMYVWHYRKTKLKA